MYLLRKGRLAIGMAVGLLAVSSLLGQEKSGPEKLVIHQSGMVPIILTAPHGGGTPIPDVANRVGGSEIKQFVTVRDTGTDLLAEKLAKVLEKKYGKPYLVVAKFERKQADANRPAKDAYESEKAKPYYDYFHKFVAEAANEVQKDWGRGLHIDIHGQAADTEAIYRGTQNFKTVNHAVDRFGKTAINGPKSVLGVLAKKGYKVVPACDSSDDETKNFGGGYIVQTYGSAKGGTIDSIQFEMGGKLRSAAERERVAEDMAEAIVNYAKEYLPAAKK